MSGMYKISKQLGWLIGISCSTLVLGVEPQNKDRQDIATLPDPLQKITTNILDLERDGLFQITGVRFGPNNFDQKDAIIWTLLANRPLTWRHVEIVLHRYRTARFYDSGKRGRRAKFSTLLFYHPQIETDASGDTFLPKGVSFDVWIYLDRHDRLQLSNRKIDTLILGPSRN